MANSLFMIHSDILNAAKPLACFIALLARVQAVLRSLRLILSSCVCLTTE